MQGAPSLAVEVLSNGTEHPLQLRDLLRSSRTVEADVRRPATGWLIPRRQKSQIFRQAGANRFGPVETLDWSRQLETPLLPGFTLALSELFA